jgi:hypothetical protein
MRRRSTSSPLTCHSLAAFGVIAIALMLAPAVPSRAAGGVGSGASILGAAGKSELVSEAAVRSSTVVRRPGGAVVRRTTVVRPGPVVRPGGWVRPANYWWRPGTAVAAGAAIGFVTAATAVAWAGAAPGPGYCWYYTDPGRTQGFWDQCP